MLSEAQRTLVKSPPELWTELSDAASLARHLAELGEVSITRAVPEKTVEWEAQDIKGTVTLAASGWGTKVTLTATREAPEPVVVVEIEVEVDEIPESEALVEPEPELLLEPEAIIGPALESPPETESRRGFFARLFRRRQKTQISELVEPQSLGPEPVVEQAHEPEPVLEPTPEPTPEPEPDLAAELAAAEELITDQTTAVLTAVLDRLGAAHHRPFSRA